MIFIRSVFTNIKRYKSKSILNLMICMILVILLSLFYGNLEGNKKQLKDMSKAITIHGQISNLNGTLQTGLVIRDYVIDGLLQSKYITNPRISVVLSACKGEFPKENIKSQMTIDAVAVTNIAAINGVNEKNITMDKHTSLDFFQKNIPICIVEEGFLKQNHWSIGQTVQLSFYYDYRDQNLEYTLQELKSDQFYIAGSVIATEGENIPQVIVPFQWAKEAFKEKKYPLLANAASFSIKNPLQLNEFKQEIHKKLHLLEIIPASDSDFAGNALVVNDETFILSASKIMDNIAMLNGFLPLVLLIIVLIGYITSYLLIQNRRGQYATMRSLGVSSMSCFFVFFLESVLVELGGGVIGILISNLLTETGRQVLIIVFGIFLICFLSGTAVALYQLGKMSVMKALAQKD